MHLLGSNSSVDFLYAIKRQGLSILWVEPEWFMATAVPLDLCHSVRSLKASTLSETETEEVDILFFRRWKPLAHKLWTEMLGNVPGIRNLFFVLVYHIYTNQKVTFPKCITPFILSNESDCVTCKTAQKTVKTNISNMNYNLNVLSINLHGLQPYSSAVVVITMCVLY